MTISGLVITIAAAEVPNNFCNRNPHSEILATGTLFMFTKKYSRSLSLVA